MSYTTEQRAGDAAQATAQSMSATAAFSEVPSARPGSGEALAGSFSSPRSGAPRGQTARPPARQPGTSRAERRGPGRSGGANSRRRARGRRRHAPCPSCLAGVPAPRFCPSAHKCVSVADPFRRRTSPGGDLWLTDFGHPGGERRVSLFAWRWSRWGSICPPRVSSDSVPGGLRHAVRRTAVRRRRGDLLLSGGTFP